MGIIRDQDREARIAHLENEKKRANSRSQVAFTTLEQWLPHIISSVSECARYWLKLTGEAVCGTAKLPDDHDLWPVKGDPVAQERIKTAMLEVEPKTSSVEIRGDKDGTIKVVVRFSPPLT